MKKEIEEESLSKEEQYKNILFLQHERLIHLIVTAFTGISTILFLLGFLLLENLGLCFLFLISLFLFIPYIFYYYKLENRVQKLQKEYFKKK
ncbi:MAG: hypothetical protein IKE70_03575 [Bacilli bacterium]|nr:hypothetical protein [Bacilli bacterium]